ncbi:YchF family ATPase [Myxococcota bacterium]|nr:YchF family ATPase [Myxococcota bacterium]
MKVGIVGFAGSGKTTVFNALTGLKADTGFGKKEKANLGMIKVPDKRIDFLTEVYKPKKTVLAEIAFVDVAGPDSKTDEGGLDKGLVDHMRQADALVNVVRAFENPGLTKGPDPMRDLLDFEGEMVLTDLIQVETRLDRMKKEQKKDQELTLMQKLHAHLEQDKPMRLLTLSDNEMLMMSGFRFLSLKPGLILVNLDDEGAGGDLPEGILAVAEERGLSAIAMAARAEAEIAELDAEDQASFLEDLGLTDPARDRFVAAAYAQLDLISFLTGGEDECRAWTIKRHTVARAAAGKIHSDIERGFIRAEVIAYKDFEEFPSEAKCRDAGKLRLEGKEYEVKDGDIVNFRFNV